MELKNTLSGRVVLVTGAGAGIGRATAIYLARAGARVAALGRGKENLDQVVEIIRGGGGEAIALPAEIQDDDAMREAIERIAFEWGRLDAVFANAGINGVWAPVEQLDAADFRRTVEVNLIGTFLTIKHAVPLLRKNGGSIIINSSILGNSVFSLEGATAYAASKGAQTALGKALAVELGPARIRVNVICPGSIDTEISGKTIRRGGAAPKEGKDLSIPLTGNKKGAPEQVAHLVWFLASDLSAHITGVEMFIDGAEGLV